MNVIVYTTTTCPYCKMLKDYLAEKGIVYTEKLVDVDDEAKKEMMEKSGGYLGVPFTVIVKDSGEDTKVVGFDRALFESVLGTNTNNIVN